MKVAEIEVVLIQETTEALVYAFVELTASTIGTCVESDAKSVPVIVTLVDVSGKITGVTEVTVGFVSPRIVW